MSFLDLTVEKNSLSLLETLTLLLNFYLLSSEQLDYQIFCFAKSRVLENANYFGKNEGINFPSEEIPGIVDFTGIPEEHGVHIGYKMNTATSKN